MYGRLPIAPHVGSVAEPTMYDRSPSTEGTGVSRTDHVQALAYSAAC